MQDNRYRLRVGKVCNNDCLYCDCLDIKAQEDSSIDDIKNEIDNIKTTNIIFSCNSEMRPDFLKLLKYTKDSGLNITLQTNGRIFSNKQRCEKVLKYIDHFEIFVNGNEETHNRIVNTKSYTQTILGIKNLISFGADVQLNHVILKDNFKDDSIVELMQNLNIRKFWPIFPLLADSIVPSIFESHKRIDSIINSAKESGIDVATNLFYNPLIPDDLNLDIETARVDFDRDYPGRVKTIAWHMTQRCNYNCSYCPPELSLIKKGGDEDYLPVVDAFKRLEGAWEILLTGGEPFVVKNLSDILDEIMDETEHTLSICTNMSSSYNTLIDMLDHIHNGRLRELTATYHQEYTDADTFLEKAIRLNDFLKQQGAIFEINCVATKNNVKRLADVVTRFRKYGLSAKLVPERTSLQDDDYYNQDEKQIMSMVGRQYGLSSEDFSGNMCYAGKDYFIIDSHGDAFKCHAAKSHIREGALEDQGSSYDGRLKGESDKEYLGNINEGTFKLNKAPHICTYHQCRCIMASTANMIQIQRLKISVIIPTYNRQKYLRPILHSLINQEFPKEDYEIIIIDDGGKDDTLEMIKDLDPECNIKYIYWPRNKPYVYGEARNRAGPARNVGMKYARGEIMLFLDSDMIADRNLLKQHYDTHSRNDNILIVGNRIRLEEDARAFCDNVDIDILNKKQDPNLTKLLQMSNNDISTLDYPWNIVVSNNLSVKKKDIVAPFNPNYVLWGFEDIAFGYSQILNGAKVKFLPEAKGYHIHHPHETGNDRVNVIRIDSEILYKMNLDPKIVVSLCDFFELNEQSFNKYKVFERMPLKEKLYEYFFNILDLKKSDEYDFQSDSKKKRILFFTTNGVGLGHLNRTTIIAKGMMEEEDVEILFITRAKNTYMLDNLGVKYHKLDTWSDNNNNNNNSFVTYMENNFVTREIINSYKPDLIVLDVVFGLYSFPEIMLTDAKIKQIPKIIIAREQENMNESIKRGIMHFNKILIPHAKAEFNNNNLIDHQKITFTGPIVKDIDLNKIKSIKNKYGITDDDFIITVTAGGGGHNKYHESPEKLYRSILDISGRLHEEIINLKIILITGPYYQKNIETDSGMIINDFEEDFLELIACSDLVISHAGYNICNEVQLLSKKSILIPLGRNGESQYSRARRLEQLGVAKVSSANSNILLEDIRTVVDPKFLINKVELKNGNRLAVKEIIDSLYHHCLRED